ncbi:MAG: MetQ/NlpA family ABC transporter substrate-binding protein [Defluviitaleaceae bacterium]|nr:MetQ/NlpA family ABC transporter substrate-binding protein [Defluviitaleaceae bacterium]
MKRITALVLCIALLALSFGACNRNDDDYITIIIGATPTPHAEILEFISPFLLEEGIRLDIRVFTDFSFPNPALSDGSLDANYFQHMPFLQNFMDRTGNQLHVVGAIHIEPMGAYSQSINHISELQQGALIAIPDCAVNGPRALILMENNGLLTLNPYAGFGASIHDIIDNPLDLEFVQIAAAMLPRVMLDEEADMSIINTNHVLFGAPNIDPVRDSLIMETTDTPYANMLVVRPEDADNPAMLTLLRHLQSERVREFILENYSGVVPVF